MLFGHKESFAIEAMNEPELKAPSPVWGRMRVWCNGKSVGNYLSEHCGLPFEDFKLLSSNLPAHWSSEFTLLTDEEIFHRLDAVVFGCWNGVELNLASTRDTQDELTWNAFTFLTNWEEMFDGDGKLFILSPDGVKVKVLHQPLGSHGCVTRTTTVSAVRIACDEFITWYDSEAARLGRAAS